MRVAVTNIGTIVSGDYQKPFADGDTVILNDRKIELVGTASTKAVASCDIVIDADGTTAIPGLIDSHVHITFGDYTPRDRKSTRLNSSHANISYAVFCLKKKK